VENRGRHERHHTPNPRDISAEALNRDVSRQGEASGKGAAPMRPLPDDALIILPVRNVVLFPGLMIPLQVGRERSRAAAQEALRLQRPVGVLLQSDVSIDNTRAHRPALGRHLRGGRALRGPPTTPTTRSSRACGASACCQFLEGYPFAVARVQ
jgi:ATP-dependent Lon protease